MAQFARLALRHATADGHAALEAVVGSIASKAAYARYLRASFAFREPLERALQPSSDHWPACLEGWAPTKIVEELRRDLRDLDLEEPSPSALLTAQFAEHPLGVCYVLEGANLGANILRLQAQKLGYSETHGARHLAAQHSAGWKSFISRIENCSPHELDLAKQWAQATFALAHRATMELAE